MTRHRVQCPGCRRQVWEQGGRYETHIVQAAEVGYCFMSGMPEPVGGYSDDSIEDRARIVACLALEVQDADPRAVWKYLAVMPPVFVRELLMLALAAIPVEGQRVEDIWERWNVA